MKLKAKTRLLALDLGDTPPTSWPQGDIDVTFTPFCRAVRKRLGSDVHGIRGSNDQHWLYVYVDEVQAKALVTLTKEIRALGLPGSPRFDSIVVSENSVYRGLLAIKYKIY